MGEGFNRKYPVIRRIQVALITGMMVLSLAVFPITVGAQASQTLSFEDQLTDGHYVYLSEITVTHGGWLDVQTRDGDTLWTNRGSDELPYFEPGEVYSGWVDLTPALTHNQTLSAVVYNDTDQNRVYDKTVDNVVLKRDALMTVQIRSTFDEGPEEWTFVRSTAESVSEKFREPQDPDHSQKDGTLDGYIVSNDDMNGNYWDDRRGVREWVAPSIYLGDRSNFYGGNFSFDAKGSVDWQTCVPGTTFEARPTLPYQVTFYAGDRELRYRFINSDYDGAAETSRIDWYSAAPGVDWTRYSIPIWAPETQTERAQGTDTGRWDYYEVRDGKRGSYASGLTEETFMDVFSNLTRVEIRAESVGSLSGTDCQKAAKTDEGHLDNVVWNVASSTLDSVESPGEDVMTTTEELEPLDDEQATETDAEQVTSKTATTTSQGANPSEVANTSTNAESHGFTVLLVLFALFGVAFLTWRRGL